MIWLLACTTSQPDEPSAQDTHAAHMSYESAASCGECHPRQYAEWQTSMHAYAAVSPVFDAMAQKAYRDSGGEIGNFCTQCHSPFGAAEGEPGSAVAADRSELSKEGISCHYCHTTVGHDGLIGNNRLVSDPMNPIGGPYEDPSEEAHAGEYRAFTTSPELCGSCHDVYKFPGLQIEEAYTEYIGSPAAQEGVRCQDCHMGPVPGKATERAWGPSAVVDGKTYPDREQATHSFVGPDYSLIDAFPYPDDLEASAEAQAAYLEQVQVLLEDSVRISDLSLESGGAGGTLTVELESLVSGHRVPTGFTSERQLWIEVVASGGGEVLFSSGTLDDDGNLRDGHSPLVQAGEAELDEQLVNLQSKNIVVKRHYGDNGALQQGERYELEVVFPFDADYIERRSLEPLEKKSWTYELPAGVDEVSVRLRYRNLPPYVLQGLQLDELMDRLRIFELDEASL